MNDKLKTQGFTLLELMIIVVIVAILAVIAYPSYDTFTRKSRMEQAKASIMSTARDMERLYTQQRSFIGAPKPADTEFFTINFAANSPTADSYEIIAQPNGRNNNEPKAIYYSSIAGTFSRCDKASMDNCEQF